VNRKSALAESVRTVRTKPRPRPEALERDLLARLGRAEGQLRGLQRMVRANAYCIDVLQQISAVRRALDRLGLLLVQDHLKSCVSEAIAQENSPRKIKELVDALDRFLA
jgi:CsoR family transcriptional regulator, copper-sensing transcriptional repressor